MFDFRYGHRRAAIPRKAAVVLLANAAVEQQKAARVYTNVSNGNICHVSPGRQEEKKTEEVKNALEEEKGKEEGREDSGVRDNEGSGGAAEGDKKEGGRGSEEGKKEGGEAKEAAATSSSPPPPPPPPPPEEIVMRVYMHCEGCARKVRRCLKGFEGVEEVAADCRTHRVVVKGRKAAEDPMRVVERVRQKSGRKVELLSPLPTPNPEEVKVEKPKAAEDKKEEAQVISVVLRVHMHCDACAQEIKKRILKLKGVEEAEPDLQSSQVAVRGVFEPAKLAEYVHKRTGKHAVVMKQEPVEKKPPEGEAAEKGKEEEEAKDEKKAGDGGDGGGDKEEKVEEEKEEKEGGEDGGGVRVEEKDKKEGGSPDKAPAAAAVAAVDGSGKVVGLIKKNEFYYYYPRYQVDYAYPPQMFSDENPNACAVM